MWVDWHWRRWRFGYEVIWHDRPWRVLRLGVVSLCW